MSSFKDIKVSVIVPVYKVQGTLEASVRSIQKQTHNNIEIILVDDGSPDKSGEICDKLAIADSRIKVIHKKNGGVSSARNAGILEATSEFLCFVDSDDEIEDDMVEKLLSNQMLTGAQLVVGGVIEYHKKFIKTVCEGNCCFENAEISDSQLINICSKEIMTFLHGKIFIRKLISENNLLFKDGLVCGEDHLFIFQYLYFAEKIVFVNDALYRYYCFNSNGATRFFPLSGQIDIFKAKEKFVRNNCTKESADEYCAKNALRNLIARFNYLAKRSIKNYDELAQAYDFYWPYIVSFIERTEVFLPEDSIWLHQNKDALMHKNIKKIFGNAKKAFIRNSKKRRNLQEFFNMSTKEKIKFIIKKFLR